MRGLRNHRDLPATARMVNRHCSSTTPARSRGARHPSFTSGISSRYERAQGRPGAWPTPMAPVRKKCTGQEPQVWPVHPGLPCANGFTAYSALPGDQTLLSPSVVGLIESSNLSASLGAPGPHDFAVRGRLSPKPCDEPGTGPSQLWRRRKSAARPARSRVHRIPNPTSVTIAKRPSCRVRTTQEKTRMTRKEKRILFARRTGQAKSA
jgi:hypothetical protein